MRRPPCGGACVASEQRPGHTFGIQAAAQCSCATAAREARLVDIDPNISASRSLLIGRERHRGSGKPVTQGGRILLMPSPPDGDRLTNGACYLPTIIDGLEEGSATCRTAIFGFDR